MDKLIKHLRAVGVLKTKRIIDAFGAIDRADFVPEGIRDLAYVDEALPIGEGQTISQPYTVAFMLELLGPKPGDKIMDIGAGSGWQTALLAYIVSSSGPTAGRGRTAGRVFAIERLPYLCDFGRKNLQKYNFIKRGVIKWICGDASGGLPEEAPFDRIIAAAALGDKLPQAWKEQLKPGGIIIAPIHGSVWKFTKRKDGGFEAEEYPGFAFVPFIKDKKQDVGHPMSDRGVKSKKWPREVLKLFVGLMLLAGMFFYIIFSTPKTFPSGKVFHIEKGQTLDKISANLKNEGFLRSPRTFKLFLFLFSGEKNIKAGDYFFEAPLSLYGLQKRITQGIYGIAPLKVTILEGKTVYEIGRQFEELGVFTVDEFLKEAAGQEGYLFPDTYFFNPSLTPSEVVAAMRDNFDKKLKPELKEEIARQGKEFSDIIIMASLIEKEAFDSEDAKIISGILWKRLEIGMGLQVDAALTYVTGKASHELTEKDLALDSPYNTYEYRGLPAGPIGNPGLEAIEAAVYPQESPYLYYLHDKNGQPHYAKTFEEHKLNKEKYLR